MCRPACGPLCAAEGGLLRHAVCGSACQVFCLLAPLDSSCSCSVLLPVPYRTQVPLGARFDAHIAPEQRFNIDAALEAAHAALAQANYLVDTGEVEVGAAHEGGWVGGAHGSGWMGGGWVGSAHGS